MEMDNGGAITCGFDEMLRVPDRAQELTLFNRVKFMKRVELGMELFY